MREDEERQDAVICRLTTHSSGQVCDYRASRSGRLPLNLVVGQQGDDRGGDVMKEE